MLTPDMVSRRRNPNRSRAAVGGALHAPDARLGPANLFTLIVFGLFWLACALGGGSSKASAATLLFLRPVTVVCLGVFLVMGAPEDWRRLRSPLLLLGALATVMACQLVRLPPGLWLALPGRERFLPGMTLVGARGAWHALSVAPDRTWDSLIGLLVPATALFGFAALTDRTRQLVLPTILVLSGASACLGVAQLGGGDAAPYIYLNSSYGFPTGFFANKNHESVLLVCCLPLLRAWSLSGARDARAAGSRWRGLVAMAAGVALIPVILVTGSRAGLLLLPLGLLGAWVVRPVSLTRVARQAGSRFWLVGGGLIFLACCGLALVLASGRALSVQRLLEGGDVLEDQRFGFAGAVWTVLRAGFPAGWGFGTFDPVFRMFEPYRLLNLSYFNNAHNDLLELLLTGGVPAGLVLLGFLWWAARRTLTAFTRAETARWPEPGERPLARAAAWAIGTVLLASLVDYPLRTPLFGAVFAQLCAWLVSGPRSDLLRRPPERAVAGA